ASLSTLVFFARVRPDLRPQRALASRATMQRLLHLSILFFVLQLASALAYSSDNLIASRLLGAAEVADYSVAVKLFTLSAVLLGLVLQPLWPAYAEAIARRDLMWVRRTLWRATIGAGVVAAAVAATFLLGFERIIGLWLHRPLHVSSDLLFGLATWCVVD